MSITFGSVTSSISTATATTRSVYHTCATGTGLLLVRLALRGASATPASVTVTYGAASVPLVTGSAATNTTSRAYSGIFALPNPSTASNLELKATWTQSANCVIAACDVFGCDSAPTAGANASGNSASPGTSTSDATPGALAVDSLTVNGGRTLSPGSGSQAAYAQMNTSTGANDIAHRAAIKTSAAPLTMAWSLDTSSNWAASVCVLLPTQAGSNGNFLQFF